MNLRMHIKQWVGLLMAGVLLSLMLFDSVAPQQLAASVVFSIAVVSALLLLAMKTQVEARVKWQWFVLLIQQIPKNVVRDIGLLALILWRSVWTRARPAGAVAKRNFNAGPVGATSATRRALVFAGISLPPNSFAIAIEENNSLLIHQLVVHSSTDNQEWPL